LLSAGDLGIEHPVNAERPDRIRDGRHGFPQLFAIPQVEAGGVTVVRSVP
jgi:hypothetical protein